MKSQRWFHSEDDFGMLSWGRSSRSMCWHPHYENVLGHTIRTGNNNFCTRSAIMHARRGKSSITSESYCKVVWTVEAEVADDQLLYLAGDLMELGFWEPQMAVPMSPTEDANLWKAEVKIACGVSFKYNYFKKEASWPPYDTTWRPGPEFSLIVPQHHGQDKNIVVRDSWKELGTRSRIPSAHSWGSWIEEMYLPVEPSTSTVPRDEDEIVRCLGTDLLEAERFLVVEVNHESYSNNKHMISDTQKDYVSATFISEREQSIEEPWLMSTLPSRTLKDMDIDVPTESGSGEEEFVPTESGSGEDEFTQMESENQYYQDAGEMLTEERKHLVSVEDSISTVILINSSICTMQRIAVLEGGKLVELLLEPVKTDVQCDSVYLGIVMKLVPHMGGAFVNIGNSRHSLMDIRRNREPFVFPPFHQETRKTKPNGSEHEAFEGHPLNHGDDHALDNVESIDDVTEIFSQDASGKAVHDDYEENEYEDDFDATESLKGFSNGSLLHMDEVGVAAGIEDDVAGINKHKKGVSLEGFLPFETAIATYSERSKLQDAKDATLTSAGDNKWSKVRKGTKIIVQVVKEGLGTKGPMLTAYPKLRSRFWILMTRCDRIGVSKKIIGMERTRLKVIAKTLQPQGFGLTVRTVAAGHSLEELQKDLEGLLSTWKNIVEHAKSAALASDEGVEGAVPSILHRAMGQTLSVVQDYFNEKVTKMVVDSPRTFHEVTNYLQEIAPDLCDRVELYDKRIPLFDEFNIEGEIDNILNKRVPLANGGSLVIEQTEALVSIDVNGGHGMFGQGNSQEKAILDVNLAAAGQIARELRLRDIGGIIVVDFIDMADESNKRLVYEEVKKAVERDRSMVKVSELSKHGLMEITRKRVRPSVTFMISEPCTCCHATGRVEALETSFSKIEQEICRLLAVVEPKADPEDAKSWPRLVLRVDNHMCNYLTSGKKTRLAILSSSLKVWILLKVARGFTRGEFEVKPFGNDNKVNKNQHQVTIPILRSKERRAKDSGKQVTIIPVKKWKTRR
ncbi:ribonuclease E/G-like protein, chloroplastic isoform X2 [Rhodamnia argentea]|uniref:Ribonuclease E/G-like protein, chloroplastic isoform X2 n=1 Tax=Rhodamnia argentea TaxID=178133 RepID=A0ABM3GRE6_9MYRT|nr:ribonuclease E/G-like protein, chloroplastic isoform X2 [Rhodamnia argentea]